MNKRALLLFLASFLLFFGLFQGFFSYIENKQIQLEIKQTQIIRETIKDRFGLFLKPPIAIATMGASYFAEKSSIDIDYENFVKDTTKFSQEIVGLNVLSREGNIIRVYPKNFNLKAVGKKTQNFEPINQSYEKGEPFWLSQPFQLFQGQSGIVIYVPIKGPNGLKGWFTSVITTKFFIERFKLKELIKAYHICIRDEATGLNYLSTGVSPKNTNSIYENLTDFYGRKISIQVWKIGSNHLKLPRYWSYLGALLLSLLVLFTLKLYEQKKKSRTQMLEISTLLQLTLKEALNNFADHQNELNVPENINYMSNLIEQINLLQAMAHNGEELTKENNKLLALLKASLKNFDEIIDKKKLKLTFDEEKFSDLTITANSWLIQHSVLNNTLFHCILYAEEGSTITITPIGSNQLKFHCEQTMKSSHDEAIHRDRRMEVAKMALKMYEGDLVLEKDMNSGIVIILKIPHDDV